MTPVLPGKTQDISEKTYLIVAPILVAAIILFLVALSDTFKLKFVIDRDKVYTMSTFSKRELMFYEIKGYLATDKYLHIESKTDGKKKVEISNFSEKKHEIIAWLDANYPDLELVESNKEKDDILSSEEFGSSIEQRQSNLANARKIATVLNWVSGLIALWAWFRPDPYEYLVPACIALPLISIIVLKVYKGIIRVDQKKNSPYPSVFWSIFASSCVLCLRALLDFNILDYTAIWIPSTAIAILLLLIIISGNTEFRFKTADVYFTVFGLSLFLFAYAYGAFVIINCFYDQSPPQNFRTKILDKRISSSKTTSYYLELAPWYRQTEVSDVSVTKEFYNIANQNDTVEIQYYKGRFEIPWFTVSPFNKQTPLPSSEL